MGLVVDLRNLVLDTNVPYVYTDLQLETLLSASIREICLYDEALNYTLATVDAELSTASPSYYCRAVAALSLQLSQIKLMQAAGGNPDDYIKFVTQDTTIDPGDAGTRLAKIIASLQKDFERALNKWIGVDAGNWMWAETQGTF